MKKLLIAVTLSLPLLASANLLTNGSFELGLTNWTTTTTAGTIYPITTPLYNVLPGAFGEIVPTDNAISQSTDAAGMRFAYFVDDLAVQTLSQSFTITSPGEYNMGFSFYVPSNGAANAGDASFFVNFAGGLTSTELVSFMPVAAWQTVNNVVNLAAGTYNFSFTFTTLGGESKDLSLDRVYVTAVPEPGTYAMFLAGLGVVGLIAMRRRQN